MLIGSHKDIKEAYRKTKQQKRDALEVKKEGENSKIKRIWSE